MGCTVVTYPHHYTTTTGWRRRTNQPPSLRQENQQQIQVYRILMLNSSATERNVGGVKRKTI